MRGSLSTVLIGTILAAGCSPERLPEPSRARHVRADCPSRESNSFYDRLNWLAPRAALHDYRGSPHGQRLDVARLYDGPLIAIEARWASSYPVVFTWTLADIERRLSRWRNSNRNSATPLGRHARRSRTLQFLPCGSRPTFPGDQLPRR